MWSYSLPISIFLFINSSLVIIVKLLSHHHRRVIKQFFSIDAAVAVAPINNTLHSLFSQIEVSLNNVDVSSATTTYSYRAYIETHLNYGTDSKNQGFKQRCTLSMTT